MRIIKTYTGTHSVILETTSLTQSISVTRALEKESFTLKELYDPKPSLVSMYNHIPNSSRLKNFNPDIWGDFSSWSCGYIYRIRKTVNLGQVSMKHGKQNWNKLLDELLVEVSAQMVTSKHG